MSNHVTLTFPAGNVEIELLDTPVVQLWKEVLPLWQKDNTTLAVSPGTVSGERGIEYRDIEQEEFCVRQINKYIDKLNTFTTGARFPYKAFNDMPWTQTNNIHRCFTLGMGCRRHQETNNTVKGGYRHQLSSTELLEYKNNYIYNNKDYVAENSLTDIFYHTNTEEVFSEVNNALNAINKWTHHYEDLRRSYQMANIKEVDFPKYQPNLDPTHHGREINLTWDVFTETGGKTHFYRKLPSAQQVKDSVPVNWYEYDVFAIKSITGKDYETCFRNYDNPLEYDVQNIQDVTGGLRIFTNSTHEILYRKSAFKDWITSFGLEEWQYVPVPIGKITKSDFNLASLRNHNSDKNTDGSGAPEVQYRNPKIKIHSNTTTKLLI